MSPFGNSAASCTHCCIDRSMLWSADSTELPRTAVGFLEAEGWPMFHDHNFARPTPRRAHIGLNFIWLPILVSATGGVIISAGILGADRSILWAGSMFLAGFVMVYCIGSSCVGRRRARRMKANLDSAFRDAQTLSDFATKVDRTRRRGTFRLP